MTIVLIILHVLACITLIAVILLQAGRGHGLTGSSFGGGGPAQSIFGTKTADVLSKATTVMAICFIITCISLDIIETRKSRSLLQSGKKTISQADLERLKEAMKKAKAQKAEVSTEPVEPSTTEPQQVTQQEATTPTNEAPPAAD